MHQTRVLVFAVVLAVLLPTRISGAVEAGGFVAFGAGDANIIVSHDGGDYLRLGMIAWGPNWAWTGFDGKLRSEAGASVGRLSAKLGGTGVALGVDFKASRPAPQQLVLNYAMQAAANTELTLAGIELAPGKVFEGRDAVVESQGKKKTVRFPLDKSGLGQAVSSIRLTDARGQATTVRFDPPVDIASDGAARILLAKDSLPANEVRKLTITIDLPAATAWYPSVAELPDEKGIGSWYPWKATGDAAESLLSMADWFDAPAGRHGRIVARGDRLIYNNKPIKLWGLNLCYGNTNPERALAEKRAAFYRRYGINSVRLHKFADGAGWAGIQSKDSCVEFDPAGLDRMDYQVAKFKEAGIYVKLSAHFGSLKLGPAEKELVPFMEEFGPFNSNRIATPHSAVHYSPELQKVQIAQMVNLLKHRNPHTGLTYAEDPAVAFVEIINEQSILFYTSMAPLKASATLRGQVGRRFCDWLRNKYGTQEKLVAAWGSGSLNIFAKDGFTVDENLDRNTILPLGNPWYWDPAQLNGSQASRKRRMLDTLQFLYTLQCDFYDRYVKAIREAGYAGEILSSNWQAGRAFSHFANLHSDAMVGTVDRHNYFGEGRANASMLGRAGSGLLSSGMQQVIDRPFMLSEWIHVFPNEMGVEGPAIIGAYGMGLQGWDVSYMFQNGDSGSFSARIGRDRWDVTAPQVMGIFPAVSRQVLRGDVKQSEVVAVRNIHVPSLFEGRLGFDDRVVQGYDDKELDSSKVPAASLAVARSVVAFTDQYADTPAFDIKAHEKDGALISTTGQLRWKQGDGKAGGFFTIDTPATKAVVGFSGGQTCDLGNVTITPQTPFSAIYVTAREPDKTIDNSRQLLIVAVARCRNTGMKFSPAGDKMLATGSGPVLMEPVSARISVRKPGGIVYALDHDGRRTGRTVPVLNGSIVIDGATEKTAYYLVEYP